MQKNTKEWIQYGSALAMLASGVALAFLCFFLNQYDIKDSVLLYVAQCLVYAGSIFGVAIYIRSKIGEVRGELERQLRSGAAGKGEEEEETEKGNDKRKEKERK